MVSGTLLNEKALDIGGTLGLTAFNAGPGAAAGEELDRISLMLAKGIKENLSLQTTAIKISENDKEDPSLLLKGYIEEYGQKNHKINFAVDGEIWLQETGAKVLIFQTAYVVDLKKEDPQQVAFRMGQAIGDYIAAHASRSKP